MSRLNHPHDAFFKYLLGDPGTARVFLGERLSAEILGELDLGIVELVSGSFVDDELAAHRTDLLYRVAARQGSEVLVYVLIEHKCQPDSAVALQLLRYMSRIWQSHGKVRPLPVIVPLVVYHGATGWQPPRLADLVAAGPALAALVPDFAIVTCDLGRIADRDLSALARLRAGLLGLKYIFRPDLPNRLPEIIDQAADEGSSFVQTVLTYIVNGPQGLELGLLRSALHQRLPEQEDEIMGNLPGLWVEEGRNKGRVEGRVEQEVLALLRLLERRFGAVPDAARQCIVQADLATLEAWFDRAIDAESLDRVFH